MRKTQPGNVLVVFHPRLVHRPTERLVDGRISMNIEALDVQPWAVEMPQLPTAGMRVMYYAADELKAPARYRRWNQGEDGQTGGRQHWSPVRSIWKVVGEGVYIQDLAVYVYQVDLHGYETPAYNTAAFGFVIAAATALDLPEPVEELPVAESDER